MSSDLVETTPAHTLIGQLLLARGLVRPSDLERALAWPRQPNERIGAVLVRLGALSEDNLFAALEAQNGLAQASAADVAPQAVEAALQMLHWTPARLAGLQTLVWVDEAQHLHAAAEDPLQSERREAVEAAAGAPVTWHYMRARELELALARVRRDGAAQRIEADHWREMAEDGPVIAFVNDLFAQAIDARASDIHIEPGEFRLRSALPRRRRAAHPVRLRRSTASPRWPRA